MKPSDIIFTQKFKDLLKSKKRIIHCEGVTGGAKSFQLGIKFFFKVFNSPKEHQQFVFGASSVTVAEMMLIDNPTSFYNIFKMFCKHTSAGVGGNKIVVTTPTGDKIIYLVGYDDQARYKKILGLSIFGFLIEEIHTAGQPFIREMFTRVYRNGGFLYTSSNGGLPDLIIYRDYLNKARPHPKYEHEVPQSTMNELRSKDADPLFEFWYYKFEDNPTMTEEQIRELYTSHPVGSFEYNSKILGIRGYVEGAIYAKYMTKEKNMIKYDEVFNTPTPTHQIMRYTLGIDVGFTDYMVFTFTAFTERFEHAIFLDMLEFNKAGIDEIREELTRFLKPYVDLVGYKIYGAFIDSAAQIVKHSLAPELKYEFGIDIADSYKYTIKERVDWGVRLLHQGRLLFTERTEKLYNSFTRALYTDKKNLTDIREFIDHIDKDRIDSGEYSITPFITEMLHFTI